MPQIIKSPQAEEDLINIWLYIAQDSLENADRFIQYLEDRFLLLAENPLMGQQYPELGKNLRGFVITKNYTAFYQPLSAGDGIEIVHVLNAALEREKHFP